MSTPFDKASFEGRVNGWICQSCGVPTYCVHVHHGTTPMFLACRAEGLPPDDAECKGTGVSMGYPRPMPPRHVVTAITFEWYKPEEDEYRRLLAQMRDHVDRGGLLIRPITDAGRAAFARRYAGT